MHFILSRYDAKNAKKAVQALRGIFNVLPVSDREIGESLSSNFKDFENGVQNFVAENHGCSLVLTRNKKDYVSSLLKVLTPNEYLLTIGTESHIETNVRETDHPYNFHLNNAG